MDSETQYQGFHGGGMSRDHTPIILPLYYPKGACAGRRYRPIAKGASSKHLGAHLEYLERGGCWFGPRSRNFWDPTHKPSQIDHMSSELRAIPDLIARSRVTVCPHPVWVPLSAMVCSL